MKKKKSNLWIELVVLLLGTLILLFAWNSIFSYPIKIFIVLVHEISHALIGIISGATIHSIEIFENLGGRCSLTGGNEFLIAFAGYFGSVILGVILFMSSFDKQKSKVAAIILTVILLLTVVNLVNDYRAIIFSFIILILMNLSPRYFSEQVNRIVFQYLGLASIMYTLIDVWQDSSEELILYSDASKLESITGVGAYVWSTLWILISFSVIYILINYNIKRIK